MYGRHGQQQQFIRVGVEWRQSHWHRTVDDGFSLCMLCFRSGRSAEVVLSRFADGGTAPIHLLDGLPDHWVLKRDRHNRVVSVRSSIIAGFIRNGQFFTRAEVSQMRLDS